MRNIYNSLPLAFAIVAGLFASTGASAATTSCANQNFDLVSAPALPNGWTSSVAMGAPTTTGFATRGVGYADSGSNAAWVDDFNDYADISLYSSVLGVVDLGSTPTVSFRHSYVLWAPDQSPNFAGAFNGGVLELSVNGGPFSDVASSGGSFTTGGYNTFLDPNFSNPIALPPQSPGRSVWSGDSGGFKTVTLTVPSTAFNGTVQLRWRLGTEGGSRSYDTHSGWWIDSLNYNALGDVIFRDGFDGACPN